MADKAPHRISDSVHFKASVQISWVPIDSLRPNPANARTHSKKQIRRLAANIRSLGFLNPIIADEANMVLAGNGRLAAAKLERLSHVSVVHVSHLTPAEKRAYVLADNRIAEQAGWDRELLAVELAEMASILPAEGYDVSLTGFEVAEIDLLMKDMTATVPAPEDMLPPAPRKTVTRRGDLWLLGKNKILCGDARKEPDFVRLMDGARASAVFCDPPYNLRIASVGGRGHVKHAEFAFASGEMSSAEYRAFLSVTLANGASVSIDGAVHYLCTDWRHYPDLIEATRNTYSTMLNLVVWNKSNAGQGSFYRSQHELIGVFRVGAAPHRNNVELGRFGRNRSNVWTYPGMNVFGPRRMEQLSAHPTVKPVALVADALLDCTARGDLVLDQFAGSGTTILSAEKVGRRAFAIEYEPRYVDIAVLRWQKMTNLEATLAGQETTFDETAAERADREQMPQPPPSA